MLGVVIALDWLSNTVDTDASSRYRRDANVSYRNRRPEPTHHVAHSRIPSPFAQFCALFLEYRHVIGHGLVVA